MKKLKKVRNILIVRASIYIGAQDCELSSSGGFDAVLSLSAMSGLISCVSTSFLQEAGLGEKIGLLYYKEV